jgi:hypothetical protein
MRNSLAVEILGGAAASLIEPHLTASKSQAERSRFVRKVLMITLVLMVSAVWLQAQDAPTTIQGCLQFKGHYFLTDSSGTVYQLSGAAQKLQAHVGHTIEVTGKPGTRTVGTTIQGGASSAKEQQVFKVSSVKHVADTCKAGN